MAGVGDFKALLMLWRWFGQAVNRANPGRNPKLTLIFSLGLARQESRRQVRRPHYLYLVVLDRLATLLFPYACCLRPNSRIEPNSSCSAIFKRPRFRFYNYTF
jgi:hypothetical protein